MFLSYDTVEAFALKRNPAINFPFLKENGELLSISANSGFLVEPRALELYSEFYDNSLKFTQYYPQYYRFSLGIVNDLEALGIQGEKARQIADYVTEENFVMYDTSDSRRLETLTMLECNGGLSQAYKNVLEDITHNVDGFIKNPHWFTKFNKPHFYDLTHILFFLTDYGRKDLQLKHDVYPCLINMGLLALLDNDADILSEICTCLSYIGADIPDEWDQFLQNRYKDIRVSFGETIASALNPTVDEYHIFFVMNWYEAMQGRPAFREKFNEGTPTFSLPLANESLLSKLSGYAHAHHFQSSRSGDTLLGFIAGLDDAELKMWNMIVGSSDLSENLIERLSGMSMPSDSQPPALKIVGKSFAA